jgi:Mg-chelatase subunit ChlD
VEVDGETPILTALEQANGVMRQALDDGIIDQSGSAAAR